MSIFLGVVRALVFMVIGAVVWDFLHGAINHRYGEWKETEFQRKARLRHDKEQAKRNREK
ncbi:MAG: hypothetical protein ABSG25_14985 [Bryobacteraceae bacterium]|jgi:hypothetical protein